MTASLRLRCTGILAAALLAAGCGDDARSCDRDSECGAGSICDRPGGGGTCVAPSATTRPALDTVSVPAGATWMGCDPAADPDCAAREQPLHEVTVPAYRIDRLEVSARAFADFLTQHGNDCGGEECAKLTRPALPLATDDDVTWTPAPAMSARPMVEVTWFGAREFCAWRGQALCSEAQWEKAARGGCELRGGDCAAATPRFPWGEAAPTCDHANMFEGSFGCGTEGTDEVGSRAAGASPYGALDMAGNVWEWVLDDLHEGYDGAPADGSAWVDDGRFRIIKGGGAGSDVKHLRGAYRGDSGPADAYHFRGFRCCSAAD